MNLPQEPMLREPKCGDYTAMLIRIGRHWTNALVWGVRDWRCWEWIRAPQVQEKESFMSMWAALGWGDPTPFSIWPCFFNL